MSPPDLNPGAAALARVRESVRSLEPELLALSYASALALTGLRVAAEPALLGERQ